jgi:hypothetical protein
VPDIDPYDGYNSRAFGGLITIDGHDNLYVEVESGVQKLSTRGEVLLRIALPLPNQEAFYKAWAIAADSKGCVYLIGNDLLYKLSSTGAVMKVWGSKGSDSERFLSSSRRYGVVVDSHDNVYVADNHFRRLQTFAEDGTFIKSVGTDEYVGDWQLGQVFVIDGSDVLWVAAEHSCEAAAL